MKIIVDALGGDHAPLEILKGCALAVEQYAVEIILTGEEELLRSVATNNSISLSGMQIVDCKSVIDVEDDPKVILREKADSSMGTGFHLLAEGAGDAFVSAGSTAALVLGATFIVKRLKGAKRAALAPVMPSDTGCYMLLDGGANLDCRPEMLQQFAIMGSCYMNKILHIEKPRVGLVNVGAEESKGRELELAAYSLLKASPINFTGNVEARDIPLGTCDVIVTDGFTGNIVLKLSEGMGKFFGKTLKGMFSGFVGKLAGALLLSNIKGFKKKMDYTEYGGAALMGIAKPVIKAHGSSNAKAFMNAIRQARDFAQNKVIDEIAATLEQIKTDVPNSD